MQEPINVSPLIRFGRYSMLVTGILYGLIRKRRLAKREVKIREIEARENLKRDAERAAKKKIATDNENKAMELLSRPPTLKKDENGHSSHNDHGHDNAHHGH